MIVQTQPGVMLKKVITRNPINMIQTRSSCACSTRVRSI